MLRNLANYSIKCKHPIYYVLRYSKGTLSVIYLMSVIFLYSKQDVTFLREVNNEVSCTQLKKKFSICSYSF